MPYFNIIKKFFDRLFWAPEEQESNSGPLLTSRIYPVTLPLAPDVENGWKPYPVFNGSTSILTNLACHVSVLIKGYSPHPPHTHDEEEILICLRGELDLTVQDKSYPGGYQQKSLKAGQFVYYPAHFSHTLQAVSEAPANYMMFKWRSSLRQNGLSLAFGRFDAASFWEESKNKDGFSPRFVFEGPTNYLKKLHCHTSALTGGAGYNSHTDPYDVVIVVFEGEVETLGERIGPHSIIFYAAGKPHDMRNPDKKTAQYIVFEFHG